MREVAEAADVGFGTVFSYASDKSGLLAMVFVEELKELPELFPERCDDKEPLDGLVTGLTQLFRFWSKIPTLSQHVLQQMEFYSSNSHMEMILARRAHSKKELLEWIVRLQAKGKLSRQADAKLAADTFFAIYTSVVREWSAEMPLDVKKGAANLRNLMSLPMQALTAKD